MDGETDQWNCPTCTLMNAFTAEICDACGTTSPLVLESFACEAALQSSSGGSSGNLQKKAASNRSRLSSHDSVASDAHSDTSIVAEMDPWAQAESEWAHVEAFQDVGKQRK